MRVTMTLIIFALVIVVTVLAFLIRNMTLDFDITGKLFIFHVHTLKSRPFGFLFVALAQDSTARQCGLPHFLALSI